MYPYGAGCVVSGKAEQKAYTIGYGADNKTPPLGTQTSKTGTFFAGKRLRFLTFQQGHGLLQVGAISWRSSGSSSAAWAVAPPTRHTSTVSWRRSAVDAPGSAVRPPLSGGHLMVGSTR